MTDLFTDDDVPELLEGREMVVRVIERIIIHCPCGWRGGKTFLSLNAARKQFDAHECRSAEEGGAR